MSKRKKYIIDPEVQWSIVRRISLHWIAFFILFLVAAVSFQVLLRGYEGDPFETLLASLHEQVPTILVMLVLLPIFVKDTFRMTNRFAGPMYRLRSGLQSLANEEPTKPIKFRDNDFWRPVADEYNRVLWRIENLERRCNQLEDQPEEQEAVEV